VAEAHVIVGVGIDLVDIARMQRLLDAKGDRALTRLFTQHEVRYAMGRAEPARHLAARVAAKEAAFKALSGSAGARAIGWRDMEVVVGTDGRPALCLHGRAECRASELAVAHAWLTITHSVATAAAVVVLERE
jgi:holo-[acyl-carrier protein] synthase